MNKTTLHTLAAFGFVALVGAGLWLAIASARYVPGVVDRIGSAAVYLGSIFNSGPGPATTATSTASTTISFGAPLPASTTTTAKGKPTSPTKAGNQTAGSYQIGSQPAVLHGLPQFSVQIGAIGYLATTSAESFIASSTVPAGSRPAVRFTIKNVGTNVTGPWRFSAIIPTRSGFVFQSQPQQSLNPGDSIDYTLGFDQAVPGVNQIVTITANFDHTVAESNTSGDNAVARLTILGS